MRRIYSKCILGCILLLGMLSMGACSGNEKKPVDGTSTDSLQSEENKEVDDGAVIIPGAQSSEELDKSLKEKFDNLVLTEAVKGFGYKNPLYTQRFGADPYAIVYEGRVYMYMTGDTLAYDRSGNLEENTYGHINTLNVISSADLVNWTDHGVIYAAGPKGASKWGNNSWAPAVAYKEIDGKTKFFVYFANGGNGIGVITSDSPIGPFEDPLNQPLISRRTPNCANVDWLFDPAVLMDDDGKAYIYFGGGIPNQRFDDPGTARVAQLGDDMISLATDPQALWVPYLFEDSGINKIGDTYYYSYCSNFSVDSIGQAKYGFGNAEIVYMTSDSPFGPFELQHSILKNPGKFFGLTSNNHHCMFEFEGKYYMAYHSLLLQKNLGLEGGYRSTNLNEVTIKDDGSILDIKGDEFGVKQVRSLNPYEKVEAETIGTMAGLNTKLMDESDPYQGTGNMVLTEINDGDWLTVYGAGFGDSGANGFTANVKASETMDTVIQIRLDKPSGKVVGYLEIAQSDSGEYTEVTTRLLERITGDHTLFFVFLGEGMEMDYWMFQNLAD